MLIKIWRPVVGKMEDAISQGSIESSSTGDEFVVVNGEPKFKLTGDINDIDEEISEEKLVNAKMASASIDMENQGAEQSVGSVLRGSQSADGLLADSLSSSQDQPMSVIGPGSSDGYQSSKPGITEKFVIELLSPCVYKTSKLFPNFSNFTFYRTNSSIYSSVSLNLKEFSPLSL